MLKNRIHFLSPSQSLFRFDSQFKYVRLKPSTRNNSFVSSPLMASSPSPRAPFWVLEALLDQTRIDPPLLKWFLSKHPNFLEEAPVSVKERLALRYLEEYEIRGAVGTLLTGTIDVTKSCEEVLCTNLTKVVDLSKPVQSANEIINQPIRQFISQKRSTLPKLSLEMVQKCALKGKIPKLRSINETFSNQEQECHYETEEHEMVIIPESTNGMHILQENPDPENNLQRGPCDNDNVLQKGPSGSGMITGEHNNACLAEINAINEVVEVPNLTNQNAELSSDDTNNFILQRRLPKPNVSLKVLKETILGDSIPILPSRSGNCNNEQEKADLPKHPSTSENSNYETASEEPNIIPEYIPTDNIRNLNPGLDSNIVPETSSETSNSLPDPFEREKAHLISSQFNATQDSLSMCIKCNKSGQVLNCSSEGCVISVHETCLDGTIPYNIDKNGFFYCPFCAYSRAGRVYKKAKKDFLQVRKQMFMFIGKDSKISEINSDYEGEENSGRTGKGKNVISTEENRGRNDKGKKVISTEDRENDDTNSSTSKTQEEGNTISEENRRRNAKGKNVISTEENRGRNCKGKKVISPEKGGRNGKAKKVISPEKGGNGKGKEVISPENRGRNGKGKNLISPENSGGNDEGKNVISPKNRGYDNGKKVISTEDCIDDSSASETQERKDRNSRVEELEKYRYVKSKPPIDDANGSSESNARRDEEREDNTRRDARENKRIREEESREGERQNKKTVGQREDSNVSSESESINEERENDGTREEERRGVQRQNKRRRNGLRENVRRTTPRYTSPVVTGGRRNKLFWSEQEVKALREGMEKFGNLAHGRIPWKEILEYRQHVFDKSRLPGDLKDKWRNMNDG